MRPHKHSITRGQMPGSLHSRRLHRESFALKQVWGMHISRRKVGFIENTAMRHRRGG